MLESRDGLSVRDGTLKTGNSSDAQLREAIRDVLSAGGVSSTCPAAVLVPRPSLKRPYQLMIAPLRSGLAFFRGMIQPDVALLIVDPESHRPSPPALLHRLYGLTAREAALASALSTGKTLEQAAEELGMTYETARSHLRRILGKTNTSRQSELILLLARLPKQAVNPKSRTG
jgi:DNA-binding CsgD family transcriptional regulator